MSARRQELLERAYGYALEHGLASLSLRPLAEAVGSSPRVLLFLFGSKDALVRELLARARREELDLVDDEGHDPAVQLWDWMCRPEHRGLLALWVDAYARSLIEPDGPWGDFAAGTVHDWLAILGRPGSDAGADAQTTTATLALLRGALLDLLATGDVERTTRAVRAQLVHLV